MTSDQPQADLTPDQHAVLATYDEQVRRDLGPSVPGWRVADLGRVIRQTGPEGGHTGCFIGWQDFAGLDDAEIDALIAEQVAYFRSLGRHSEWKHYDHDRPSDLSDRLVAAGLEREDPEALVIGETAAVLDACRSAGASAGVRVRRLDDPADLARIGELQRAVWPGDRSWIVGDLATELDDEGLVIYLAEAEATGALMSAAWIRFVPGTDFAGLWGGSTHPDLRRRGAYRSLVAARAELAAERGVRYLQVDATPNSEPILRRLGLERLSTTTPHTLDATA